MRRLPLLLVLALAPCAAVTAASVDTVSRRVTATVAGRDQRPAAGGQDRAERTSGTAGTFRRNVATEVQANENFGSATGNQDTAINRTAATFAGTGRAAAETDTAFDEGDFINDSFIDVRGLSHCEFEFSVERTGFVWLEMRLTAETTGDAETAGVAAALRIEQAEDGALVWTAVCNRGAKDFVGEIPVGPGRYRFTVSAEASLLDAGFMPGVGSANATFAVRGSVRD